MFQPLREVTVTLKQIDPSRLNGDGLAAIRACFSGFFDPHLPSEEVISEGMRDYENFLRHFGNSKPTTAFDRSRARRYAGDFALGRGKYHSVCKSPTGDDDETLIRELEAYYSAESGGVIDIFDSTISGHASVLAENPAARIYDAFLALVLHPINGAPHSFTRTFSAEPMQHWVVLPLTVTTSQIHDVIDLRSPDVAEWFAIELSRCKFKIGDVDVPAFATRPPLRSFAELLPSLFEQSIGGGHSVSQIAGLWLRQCGAKGLIYPSARSDSRVRIRNGTVTDWSGWCFVDYRNAPEPAYALRVELGPQWSREVAWEPGDISGGQRRVFTNSTISFEDAGAHSGSWSVVGLEKERRANLLRNQVFAMLHAVLGDDMFSDDEVRALVKVMYLDPSIEHLGGFSHTVKTAVLGHPTSRASLGSYWRRLAENGLATDSVQCVRLLARLGVPLVLSENGTDT